MKFNKWTVGLAAVGAVSLASVAQADEKTSTLSTMTPTVLSGYVDTSMQWNIGDGGSHAPSYKYGGAAKADGFNLDSVKISLEKPLDESEWAAGYKVDLMFGPDANVLGTTSTGANTSDFAIRQAYVALRAPVGNGLDFKVGVFDSVIGYESTDAINNPNFTRSWGHTFEPSEHTGVLSTYRFNNIVSASLGIADTLSPAINGRSGGGPGFGASPNQSYKTYLASVALTAPDDWGFLAGSSLYSGIVNGFNGGFGGQPQTSFYVGATINTPVTGLRTGISFDYIKGSALNPVPAIGAFETYGAHAWAAYASYQATEKLSVHGRLEYFDISSTEASALEFGGAGIASSTLSMTGTVQYDLWKNVLSRIELRWDRALDGTDAFGRASGLKNQSNHIVGGSLSDSFIIAANIIYKF